MQKTFFQLFDLRNDKKRWKLFMFCRNNWFCKMIFLKCCRFGNVYLFPKSLKKSQKFARLIDPQRMGVKHSFSCLTIATAKRDENCSYFVEITDLARRFFKNFIGIEMFICFREVGKNWKNLQANRLIFLLKYVFSKKQEKY